MGAVQSGGQHFARQASGLPGIGADVDPRVRVSADQTHLLHPKTRDTPALSTAFAIKTSRLDKYRIARHRPEVDLSGLVSHTQIGRRCHLLPLTSLLLSCTQLASQLSDASPDIRDQLGSVTARTREPPARSPDHIVSIGPALLPSTSLPASSIQSAISSLRIGPVAALPPAATATPMIRTDSTAVHPSPPRTRAQSCRRCRTWARTLDAAPVIMACRSHICRASDMGPVLRRTAALDAVSALRSSLASAHERTVITPSFVVLQSASQRRSRVSQLAPLSSQIPSGAMLLGSR